MKNIRKTTDWIEMALEDLDAAVADVTEERYLQVSFMRNNAQRNC
jgi:hypothetical protein